MGNRERGAGFRGGEAGWCTPALGGCRGEGGGGLNIFFRGRNVHQGSLCFWRFFNRCYLISILARDPDCVVQCPNAWGLTKSVGEPKGPSCIVFSTESDSVVFCYSVVSLLCC